LVGNGTIPEEDTDAVMRALLDCPVHAIIEMSESPRAVAKNVAKNSGS